MAKIVCHSTSQRNVPPPRDRQNASSEVAMRRSTPVACHTVWAKGQVKNKCWQSSTALTHNGHSTGASGILRPSSIVFLYFKALPCRKGRGLSLLKLIGIFIKSLNGVSCDNFCTKLGMKGT